MRGRLTLTQMNTGCVVVARSERPIKEDQVPPHPPPDLSLYKIGPSACPHWKWAIDSLLLGTETGETKCLRHLQSQQRRDRR